jgi:hypothetical protein
VLDAIVETIGVALRSGLFLAGLGIGFGAGVAYAVCRRWWRDYKTSKGLVKGLRKGAIRSVPRVIKWGAVAGVGLIVAIAGMTATGNVTDGTPTQPAGVPSAPSSSAR